MSVDSSEDLYGLPLERFIPERAALAKALRLEKRREEAVEVSALRKPSVAAWAVNQLVRARRDDLGKLFEAGDALARAQDQAAAGKGGGDAMREATHRQREVLGVLLQAAEGLLDSQGQSMSQTTLERVSETLRAAAIDEQARQQVAAGSLTHELRFVGLGIGGLAPSPTDEKPPSRASKADHARPETEDKTAAKADAQADAARRAAAKQEAARQHAVALKAARRAEDQARRAAARADKELAAAQARQEAAAASLREADALLSTAARTAKSATDELAAAEQAVRVLDQP